MRRRPRRGQSLVELALVMPVFALILIGAVDLGRMFFYYERLTSAVKEGAAFASHSPTCVTSTDCADPDNITYHVNQEGAGSLTNITVTCYSGMTSTTKACSAATSGDTVQVHASYVFTPLTGQLVRILGSTWTLNKTAQLVIF